MTDIPQDGDEERLLREIKKRISSISVRDSSVIGFPVRLENQLGSRLLDKIAKEAAEVALNSRDSALREARAEIRNLQAILSTRMTEDEGRDLIELVDRYQTVVRAAREVMEWLDRNNLNYTAHGRHLFDALAALDAPPTVDKESER